MTYKAHPDFSIGDDDLSSIGGDVHINQKHQELREVTDVKVRTLEAMVRQKDLELAHAKENFKTLTVDFEYNLGLIKERDEELERYEEAMETMKLAVSERDQESAELRVMVETLQAKLRDEMKRFTEMEGHYQQQSLQSKGEIESVRKKYEVDLRNKEDELRSLHERFSKHTTQCSYYVLAPVREGT
eukprot:TRINITY_DN20364_c0_g1_i1.p1 TRINITY_DN20364_c0_g1~~TRINITY_DN20364_c0_g1_i1.p1  ORF type:complete len:204 (+),score=57.30 TRINITY_DN20364_c0_g1_i1:53-613(+)